MNSNYADLIPFDLEQAEMAPNHGHRTIDIRTAESLKSIRFEVLIRSTDAILQARH